MTKSKKDKVLVSLADLLKKHETEILAKNQLDIDALIGDDISMKDRLTVDEAKVEGMIKSLQEVATQNDPEGKILYELTREDGLHIINKRVPFGTILIIYESRPDVTIEAAATAFKAGNKILLKGGRESLNTNLILTKLWQKALAAHGFETDFVEYLNLSREETQKLIKGKEQHIDLIIPRGGEALIKFVSENSSVPVIVSGRGNNFIYIDEEFDADIATQLILNGKQRISVCNALDKVIINRNMPNLEKHLKLFTDAMHAFGVETFANSETAALSENLTVDDSKKVMYEEFLAPRMYFLLVDNMNEAVQTINKYSGGHSAVIVSSNAEHAEQFMQTVDCGAVYHNASSRFTDGGQFGVGAEIAISTQKIHFRGPLGAQELLTNKWFVYGAGHVRDQQPAASSCNHA